MTEATRLNERELLALGMSRSNVAALRNLQNITGGDLVDPTTFAEITAILIGTVSEMRGHVGRLQSQIDALLAAPKARPEIRGNDIEILQMQASRRTSQTATETPPVFQRNPIQQIVEQAPSRTINIADIQRQIDEIKTYLGI